MNPAYIEVLKDSFFSSFVFTFSREFAFKYTLQFEQYDPNMIAVCATIGSIFGFLLTYLCFFYFAKFFQKTLESSTNYFFIQKALNKYGFIICAWSLIPDFKILLPVFAGMVRYNIKAFIFFIILYRTSYYFYIIYG